MVKKSKSEEHFDEWSKAYGRVTFELPYFLKWNIKRIIKKIDFSKNPTIFDLGTGEGKLLLHLSRVNSNCNFIGIDISQGMINQAKKNFKKLGLKGKFIKSSMSKIDLKNNSVDYVVSNAAIHHIRNKRKLFSEVYRILRKNGKLIVSDSFEKEDVEYKKKRAELKKKDSRIFNKYVKDIKKIEEGTLENFKKMKIEHPTEYHIYPKELEKILEDVGFKDVEVSPTPYYFGIYSATKR